MKYLPLFFYFLLPLSCVVSAAYMVMHGISAWTWVWFLLLALISTPSKLEVK
jgi:hypothetical protein